MATTHTTYEEEIASIKSELSALRDDMGRLTKTISDSVAAEARPRSARLRDTAESAREEIERLAAEARERGEAGVNAVGRQIEERPFTSALIAFAVGFVLCKLLPRLPPCFRTPANARAAP